MNRNVIVSLIAIIAIGLADCTNEKPEPTSIPATTVLIVESRSRGHENPALRAKYDNALRTNFAKFSIWPTVHMSSMDERLDEDNWNQTMEENGVRYFLSTRVTLDRDGLMFVTATISDGYTLPPLWSEQYVDAPQEVTSLAVKVADSASEVLGDP